jgi:hypothetical protein
MLLSGKASGPRAEAYARQRLCRARDYAIVVRDAATELLRGLFDTCDGLRPADLTSWVGESLSRWRAAAGYAPGRRPAEWEQPVAFGREGAPTLAQRLRDRPDADPAEVETAGDLLWYADLVDALAQLAGIGAAPVVWYASDCPGFDVGRPARIEPVPAAVADAAWLVSLGARVPPRPRTWAELVAALRGDAAVAEALTGAFAVPAPLAAVDGVAVPGTGLRFELGREPRQLAGWAGYMSNCIADDHYLDAASAGQCVLGALRDEDGVLVANVELHRAATGWRLVQLQGRFNRAPGPALETAVREWLAAVPAPDRVVRAAPAPRTRSGRRGGRPPARRLAGVLGAPLADLVARRLAEPATAEALTVLAAVGARPASGWDVLTVLRRADPDRLALACHEALDGGTGDGGTDLASLWSATAVRPLAAALAALDPAVRRRYERLGRLTDDAPLPGSLRTLARRPAIATARSMDLVAHRLRTTIGRLVTSGDPAVARSMAARPATAPLCALALVVTTAGGTGPATVAITGPDAVTVPGFPASSLTDEAGPWRRAWPDAAELGAVPERFRDRVAAGGVRVPAAWLGTGGWSALWHRAAAH